MQVKKVKSQTGQQRRGRGCPRLTREASGQVTCERGLTPQIEAGRESQALGTACARAWKQESVACPGKCHSAQVLRAAACGWSCPQPGAWEGWG